MTNQLCIAFYISFVCMLFSDFTTGIRADEATDHAALRELVAKYEIAIKNKDPGVLEPHLANDFSGVMVDGEDVASFQTLDAYWNKTQELIGEGGTYQVKVLVPQPAIIVGDLAYAHGTTEDKVVLPSGKEFVFQGYWTAICRRDKDQWKIVRVHASMHAISNPFVTSIVKASTISGGIIGGIIGFLIGSILFWMLGRRRRPTVS